jgi:hypothetical protein
MKIFSGTTSKELTEKIHDKLQKLPVKVLLVS